MGRVDSSIRVRAGACTLAVLLALAAGGVRAQDADAGWFRPGVDPQALRQALGEDHVTERWIYHDLVAARAEAQRSGKPILALFRCVPCGSAPGLDGAVCTLGGAQASEFEAQVREAGGDLPALLDQFVPVRMVKFNGVNRNLFRFDRDVPYAVMFLNADGAVYGRYGTRTEQDRKTLPRHNLASFQQSLRRALALHLDYPGNSVALVAKRGPDEEPAHAEDMETFEPFPGMRDKPPAINDCVHCHTVGEAEMRQTIAEGTLTQRTLNPYPLPENIGLNIDIEDGLRVAAVAPESLADRAGIRAGDLLIQLAGQPLVSEADIQWVLEHAPDTGSLPAVIARGEALEETAIPLEGEWWKGDGSWRATLHPLRPGLNLRPDPDKSGKGVAPEQMGLLVNWSFGAAREAGLQRGDLVVAVDGRTDLLLEADLLNYVHVERPELKHVEIAVLREGKTVLFTLPIAR